jgi:hypothetical protein
LGMFQSSPFSSTGCDNLRQEAYSGAVFGTFCANPCVLSSLKRLNLYSFPHIYHSDAKITPREPPALLWDRQVRAGLYRMSGPRGS